jgi:hypothetical protein
MKISLFAQPFGSKQSGEQTTAQVCFRLWCGLQFEFAAQAVFKCSLAPMESL